MERVLSAFGRAGGDIWTMTEDKDGFSGKPKLDHGRVRVGVSQLQLFYEYLGWSCWELKRNGGDSQGAWLHQSVGFDSLSIN